MFTEFKAASSLPSTAQILAAVAASAVLLAFVMSVFAERPVSQDGDGPASHFKLRELVARRTIVWFSFLCALPFAGAFLMVSIQSDKLGEAINGPLLAMLLGPGLSGEFGKILRHASWLNPLVMVIVPMILFAPYVRAPVVLVRNLVFAALGIDERVNEAAERAAGAVLRQMSRDDAERALERVAGSRPAHLPTRLEKASEQEKLAFQLLFFGRAAIQKHGTRQGLAATLEKIGVGLREPEDRSPIQPPPDDSAGRLAAPVTLGEAAKRPPVSYALVFAALVLYAMLCVAYIIVAIPLRPWLESSGFIEWPRYWDDLSFYVLQKTLSFVFPLAAGIYLFTARRRQQPSESLFQTYVFVLTIQFMFSLFVNLSFAALSGVDIVTTKNEVKETFFNVKVVTDAFAYSLTPGVALLAWMHCGRMGISGASASANVCIAAAIAFCACQLLNESTSGFYGYYWHELVFGAFITMAYGLAALVAKDVLPAFGTASAILLQPVAVASTGGAD